jgi:hypothetical protein
MNYFLIKMKLYYFYLILLTSVFSIKLKSQANPTLTFNIHLKKLFIENSFKDYNALYNKRGTNNGNSTIYESDTNNILDLFGQEGIIQLTGSFGDFLTTKGQFDINLLNITKKTSLFSEAGTMTIESDDILKVSSIANCQTYAVLQFTIDYEGKILLIEARIENERSNILQDYHNQMFNCVYKQSASQNPELLKYIVLQRKIKKPKTLFKKGEAIKSDNPKQVEDVNDEKGTYTDVEKDIDEWIKCYDDINKSK